ncbi:hypothetical protein OURE66S_04635 [Oligella ureolytica]
MQTIGVNAIDAAQSHLNLPLYVPNEGGASSLFHFNQIVLVSEATDLRAGNWMRRVRKPFSWRAKLHHMRPTCF